MRTTNQFFAAIALLAMLAVSCGEIAKPLDEPEIEVYESSRSALVQDAIPADAESAQKVTFMVNGAWTTIISSITKVGEVANWVKVTPDHGNAGTFTLNISIDKNTGSEPRSAAIKIVCGDKFQIISITQKGVLKGLFSVSDTKQVYFSPGNLQAKYDGSKYNWGFAANQFDFVGNAAGNTTIGTQSKGDVVDLFGWSTSATYFGISTSTSNSDYSGDFVDWGELIGDGTTWRTLSTEEWQYLLKKRANASSLYKPGVTVCDKDKCEKTNCLIIAPDGFTGTIAAYYDASTWPVAEAAGLVCLPAAGLRNGSRVSDVDFDEYNCGYYWSSSARSSHAAYPTVIFYGDATSGFSHSRYYGYSVRLIADVK